MSSTGVTTGRRVFGHGVLLFFSVTLLVPLLWALYISLRPVQDTIDDGYFSWPDHLNLDNYTQAWDQAHLAHYFGNTMHVLIPAMIVVLVLSCFLGYALTRFSLRMNVALLMLFTAGNLLPPQVIITPLFRLYLLIPFDSASGTLYDTYTGVILIHIAFQMGFCTFVMSNFMRTIPHELTESALIDGAGVVRQFFSIILPLCRAPLAALATLEFTWIYNDYFWARILMPTGSKRPITSALDNLQGNFFHNDNLIAAGSVLVAIPTIVVFVI
ncbi:MAG: carbohydrate ABC transporter permease, partial [Nocardioidaceae bacterium]